MHRTRALILGGIAVLALGLGLRAAGRTKPSVAHSPDTATAVRPRTAAALARSSRPAEPVPPAIRRHVREVARALSGPREELRHAIDELAAAAGTDPAMLAGLVRAWERRTGTELGDTLGVALGFIEDPTIAPRALAVARGARRREDRLSALQLLDRIDSTDPAVIEGLVDLLDRERDPAIIAAAIYGLGHPVDDAGIQPAVIAALQHTASNGDPEVRRRSVIALAEWAGAEEDVAPVVARLEDPSPLVRTGAAFALGRTRHLPPAAAAHIAALAADDTQDWTMRRIARNTAARVGGFDDAVQAFDDDFARLRALQPPPVDEGDGG